MTDGTQAALDESTVEAAPRSFLLRATLWSLLAQVVPALGSIGLTPFVLERLGVTRFGLFAVSSAVVAFAGSFDGGVGASAIRYFSIYSAGGNKAATSRLFTSALAIVSGLFVLAFSIIYIFSTSILAGFGSHASLLAEGSFLLRALVVCVLIGQIRSLLTALLAAERRYALASASGVLTFCVYAAVVVVSLNEGYGLRGIAIANVIQGVVGLFILILPASRLLALRHCRLLSRRELKSFLGFSLSVQGTSLAGLITTQADALIIGFFLSIKDAGFFSAGASLANQLRIVPANALGPISTLIAREHGQYGEAAALAIFVRLQKAWVRAVTGWAAVAVGSIYFGELHWLGNEFRISAELAVVLALSALTNLWTGPLNILLAAVGRPQIELVYGFVGVAINLVLTVPLTIFFGLQGDVVATVASGIVSSLLLIVFARRLYREDIANYLADIPWRAAAVTLAATAALEATVSPLLPYGVAGLLSVGAVACLPLAGYAGVVIGWQQLKQLLRPSAA